MPHTEASRARILIAFACVYLFWGSTFLGIRYAVAYVSPAFVSGLRYGLAGIILMAIFAFRGKSLGVPVRELRWIALISVMMLTGNNVLLAWAEQYVTSGFASLVMAGIPIFIALLEVAIPGGEPLNPLGWTGTLLGLAGLVLLLWRSLHQPATPGSHQAFACMILLLGGVSWAAGSVLSRRLRLKTDPFLASAWQMVIAGGVNVLIGTLLGGWATAQWNRTVFTSLLYLAIFGSLVGYSAYTYLLHHVPVAKVATYAYINPIVAVALGALFLHERLVGPEWAGMAVILLAVALVTTSKMKPPAAAPVEGDLTAEQAT